MSGGKTFGVSDDGHGVSLAGGGAMPGRRGESRRRSRLGCVGAGG
jgi:hypothetical protein